MRPFRTWLRLIAPLLLLAPRAQGFDQRENEGRFTNTGSFSLYCYKDVQPDTPEWKICYQTLAPGQSCRADAVGASLRGPVFKIPNHTSFTCAIGSADSTRPECSAANGTSAVTIKLALVKHLGGYEDMGWERFYSLMTGGRRRGEVPVEACGRDWSPLQPLSCPGAQDAHDGAMASITPVAAVLPLASVPDSLE